MTSSGPGVAEQTSTKPYLLRALYEWCADNGLTPYLSVIVDAQTHVPMEYVRDGEIVLNIGPLATSRLHIGNETIECTARFSGSAREMLIPVNAVAAIYARENGQGMSFEVVSSTTEPVAPIPAPLSAAPELSVAPDSSPDRPEPTPPRSGGKPALRRVK